MKKKVFYSIGFVIAFIIFVLLVFGLHNMKISTGFTMWNFVSSVIAGWWIGGKIPDWLDLIWEYLSNKTK